MSNLQELIAGVGHVAHNRVTFVAATTGKVGTVALFNVTGQVAVRLFAVGEVTVTGSGTIEVGTAITTAGLCTQTSGSNIVANEIWHDATPDASVELSTVVAEKIVNQNIILTVASATLTAGRIKFVAIWKPISEDGYLEPANLGGSASPSLSPSASTSPSSSLSPSASTSPSSSLSSSPSASVSPSASTSPSSSASLSRSPSASNSPSASASPSASTSPSSSRSPSASASPSFAP